MKNIFKYISMAVLALSVLALNTACDDDDDDWAAGEADDSDVPGVYFGAYTASYELDPDEATELTMTLYRHTTSSALSVSLDVTENTDDVFEVPSTVAFASGESETSFTISFPSSEVGVTYTLSLEVPEEYVGIYMDGYWQTSLSIERVKWNSLGNATYTDDFMTTFWSVGNQTYEVEIQEKDSAPGLYRLVNPYGAAYPWNETYDDGTADWDTSQDWYFYIDAQDPDGVYIELQETGMDWGYGNIIMGSLAYYYMAYYNYTLDEVKSYDYTGTLADGVITFPSNTLLIGMPDYNSGSYYYANTNGAFMVVLPGYSAPSDDDDTDDDTDDGDEEEDPLDGEYSYSDIDTDLEPDMRDGYYGTYSVYAKSYYDSDTERDIKASGVTLTDGGVDDYSYEWVTMTGFWDGYSSYYGFTDETDLEFYYGDLYFYCHSTLGYGSGYYFTQLVTGSSDGSSLSVYGTGNAGYTFQFYAPVYEGYLALIDYYAAYGYTYGFNGIALMAYSDEEYTTSAGYAAIYTDIMLVAEDADASAMSIASQRTELIKSALAEPRTNFVETDKAYVHSIIESVKAEEEGTISATASKSVLSVGSFNREASFTADLAAPAL